MSRSYSPDEIAVSREGAPSDARKVDRPVEPEEQRQDLRKSGGEDSQERTGMDNDVRPTGMGTNEARRPYQLRGRTFTLRTSEIETMADIGKFRAIDAKDLEEFGYAGDRKHLEADFANLRKQGLIVERAVPRHETRPRRLVALTKEGRQLLAATNAVSKGQALYNGFTKPREAHHDADLYRLYQRGLEQVQREGGTNVRVVLDAELKRNLYRDSAKAEQEGKADQTQSEIAERHGLQVVDGKIPVPDLRIEYETSDHEPARLDLELATEHYRARNIAQKARAGFSLYARAEDASNLRRILDQQELTAKILQL
jgi:DNA-binding PadR family transcriptional regulator